MKRYIHDPSVDDKIERYMNQLDAEMEANQEPDSLDDFPPVADHFELLDRKDVRDSDGFWTEYSLYEDVLNDRFVTVFGDHEIYTPEGGDFDMEFDDREEAYEFFEDYEGIYDDDEET